MAETEVARQRTRLDRAINGILAGIGIQFFLGMWLNLYGSFPASNSAITGAFTDGSDPILVVHAALGVLLLVGTIGILVMALRDPMRSIRGFALLGLVGTLLAGAGGSGFVTTGYSSASSSFVMAVGFGVALTAYYEGLVRLRTYPVTTGSPPPGPARAPVSP